MFNLVDMPSYTEVNDIEIKNPESRSPGIVSTVTITVTHC